MHWTAGFHLCYASDVTGPPPVMCIVRRHRHHPWRINMDIVYVMWITVGAYFVAQCYTLIAWRRAWRIAAVVPLVGIIPVVVLTFQGYRQQSNLWPIFLLFAGPVALLYLVALMVIRATRKKS